MKKILYWILGLPVFIFILLVILGLFVGNFKKDSPEYTKLEQANEQGGIAAVMPVILELAQVEDLNTQKTLVLWLKNKADNHSEDFRYGFIYSDQVYQIMDEYSKSNKNNIIEQLKSESSFYYFSSALRLENAISKCSDTTAGLSARYKWTPENFKFKRLFTDMSSEEKERQFNRIVDFASSDNSSISINWVCADGVKIFGEALGNNAEIRKVQKSEAPMGEPLGSNVYMVNTEPYAEFVSENEWNERKKENIEKLKKYLFESSDQ